MKLKNENGLVLYFDKKGNSFAHLVNDWAQIIGHWNWYSFTLINISAENDIMVPGWEFEFVIFGLGFRIRINKNWEGTEFQKRIDNLKTKNSIDIKKTA